MQAAYQMVDNIESYAPAPQVSQYVQINSVKEEDSLHDVAA